MTPRKRWPNEAKWACEDCIALSQEIDRQAQTLLQAIENNQTILTAELSIRLAHIQRSALLIDQKLKEAATV